MNFTFDWIASHRWAILPEMMKAITKDALMSTSENTVVIKEALAVRDGEVPEWSYRTEVFDGVAVIPVIGPIYSKGSYYYGGSSVTLIAKDFNSALEDPSIKAIVFNVNSPGGEITGVSELSNMIYNSRGKKPIVSYIGGMGASAAIWIPSAADKVVIADTGEAGSIGVVSVHYVYKDMYKRMGIQEIEIVSSQSPKKRLDVTTPEGKVEVQRIVDELADVFVSAVARNRNVSTDTVISKFGQGSILVGQAAVDAGLADEVGSLESVLKSLNVNKQTTISMGGFPMNIEELKAKHPETFNAAVTMGKQAGIDESKASAETFAKTAALESSSKEQARILGILELSSIPGAQKIVDEAVKNTTATKESVALQILQAQKAGTQSLQAALNDDNGSLTASLKQVETNTPSGGKNDQASAEALGKTLADLANKIDVKD